MNGFESDNERDWRHLSEERLPGVLRREEQSQRSKEDFWKCSDEKTHRKIKDPQNGSYKDAIAEWVKEDVGGEVTASDISTYHKKLCNAIPESDATMQEIIATLKEIVE